VLKPQSKEEGEVLDILEIEERDGESKVGDQKKRDEGFHK
jgi:hypothetical protein